MSNLVEPLAAGLIVFGGSFVIWSATERVIHHLTHNPDVNYKWGVWTFSLLAAVYAFATSLGRH